MQLAETEGFFLDRTVTVAVPGALPETVADSPFPDTETMFSSEETHSTLSSAPEGCKLALRVASCPVCSVIVPCDSDIPVACVWSVTVISTLAPSKEYFPELSDTLQDIVAEPACSPVSVNFV